MVAEIVVMAIAASKTAGDPATKQNVASLLSSFPSSLLDSFPSESTTI
jgi:hypothetical protein